MGRPEGMKPSLMTIRVCAKGLSVATALILVSGLAQAAGYPWTGQQQDWVAHPGGGGSSPAMQYPSAYGHDGYPQADPRDQDSGYPPARYGAPGAPYPTSHYGDDERGMSGGRYGYGGSQGDPYGRPAGPGYGRNSRQPGSRTPGDDGWDYNQGPPPETLPSPYYEGPYRPPQENSRARQGEQETAPSWERRGHDPDRYGRDREVERGSYGAGDDRYRGRYRSDQEQSRSDRGGSWGYPEERPEGPPPVTDRRPGNNGRHDSSWEGNAPPAYGGNRNAAQGRFATGMEENTTQGTRPEGRDWGWSGQPYQPPPEGTTRYQGKSVYEAGKTTVPQPFPGTVQPFPSPAPNLVAPPQAGGDDSPPTGTTPADEAAHQGIVR